MVAIITGNGAGIENSSANVLGGNGQVGSASLGRSGESVYVNAATGNLVITDVDEMLVGRGPDAVVSRTYNSLGAVWDGDNGDPWRAGVYRRVTGLTGTVNTAGSTITRTDWDGSEVVYTWVDDYLGTGQDAYVATDGSGAYDTLTYNSSINRWTWTDSDTGTFETYDGNNGGRIISRGVNATIYQTYNYTGSLLTKVLNSGGTDYTLLVYGSGADANRLQYLETHVGAAITTRTYYDYDTLGRLSQVIVNLDPTDNSETTGTNYVTTYTYVDTSNRISSITQSDGTLLEFTYFTDGTGRVETFKQTIAGSTTRTTTFAYLPNRVTTVTDQLGQVTRLTYDASNNLLSVTLPSPGGNEPGPAMTFTYNANGDVTSVTSAGNRVVYEYDGHGNRKLERDSLGNTVTREFSATNDVLTETRWAGVDPDGAGSGQPTAPMTTRFAYDSARNLRFVVDAEGRVTEYGYSAYRERTSEFRHGSNLYSLAGLTPTDPISEPTLTSWASGLADKSSGQRTETVYDIRGNVSWTISYEKLLASGAFDTSSVRSRVIYGYGPGGELLSRQIEGSTAATYLYDGLNRIRSSTDANGITTTIGYNDASGTTTVSLANGLVQVSSYDRAGNLISFAESGTGVTDTTTTYKYDVLGRLRLVAAPKIASETTTRYTGYYFYDADGRKVAEIDGDGSVTEFRYDSAGRITSTTSYATLLTTTQLGSLVDANGNPSAVTFAQVRPSTTNVNNRWNWTFYDPAGRVIRTIDGTGAVTVFEYDAASRLLSSTELATRMSGTAVTALRDATLANNLLTSPTTTAPWTLANATLVATTAINGTNAYTLDVTTAGTAATASTSGQPVTVAKGDTASFTITLKAGTATSAILSLIGSVTGTGNAAHSTAQIVSGPGSLLQSSGAFQVTGLGSTPTIIRITRTFATTPTTETFSAKVQVGLTSTPAATDTIVISNPIVWAAPALPAADSANDRSVRNFYDASGRLIGMIDAEGYVSKIEYDKAGRKTHTIARDTKPTVTTGDFGTIFTSGATAQTVYHHDWWVYDARGFLRATVDSEGTLTRFTYTAAGYVSQQTSGQKLDVATLIATAPTFTTLPNAGANEVLSVASWTYDGWGKPLTEVVTLTGSTTTTTRYVYDSVGNLISTTTQFGAVDARTYSHRYDTQGRLIGELSAAGSVALAALGSSPSESAVNGVYAQYGWTYTYDSADRLIARTGPAGTAVGATGAKTVYYYNADDSLAYEINTAGEVTEYRYDALGQQTSLLRYSVRVATTGLTGGAVGTLPGTVTAALTADTAEAEVKTAYNVDGTVASTTDPRNYITSYTYNAFGELRTATEPLDNNGPSGAARTIETTRVYDRRGLLKSETVDSAAGGKMLLTTYDYDAFGRAVKVTDASLKETTSTYDREGRLKSVTDALGSTTTYDYDPRGNRVRVTDHLGRATRYVYDRANRRVATIDALGSVTLNSYDADGRVTVTRDYFKRIALFPVGTVEVTEAALTAALTTAGGIDAVNDHVTRYAYDVDGQLKYGVDALRHVVEYSYDASGNVIRTTAWDGVIAAPGGGVYTTAHIAGQVALLDPAKARVTRTVYDATGRAAFSIDALGQVIGRTYDAKGLVIKEVRYGTVYTGSGDPTYADLTTGPTAWLAPANQAQATDDRVSRAYYDLDGNLLYSINGSGQVTGYSYNKTGSVTQQVRYAALYAASDATTLANLNGLASATGRITKFSYDSAGRLIDTIDPDGFHTQLTLDAMGRVTQSTTGVYLDANGAVNATLTRASTTAFEYDAVGRVTRQTFGVGTPQATATKLKYDALGRLIDKFVGLATTEAVSNDTLASDTQATVTHWTYDELGRVKTETRGYTDGDPAELQYGYDSLGRVQTTTDARGTVTTNAYDAIDQLSGQTVAMAGTGADIATGYTYDSFGGVVKTVDPRGNESFSYYDKLGRVWLQYDGIAVTETDYSVFGEVYQVTRRFGTITNTPSVTLLPAYAADPRDATTTFTYCKCGALTSTVDAMGYTESYTLNAYGERETVTSKLGSVTTYTYNKRGMVTLASQVISQRDGNGNGNIISGTSTTIQTVYQYDARGNRTGMIEAAYAVETRTTNYEYDALDRLTKTYNGAAITITNSTTLATTTSDLAEYFAYDRRGNLIDKTDAAGQHSYAWYDDHDRKTYELSVGKTLTQWGYDPNGNATSVRIYGSPINPTGTSTPPSVTGLSFRETLYDYDRANRQIAVRIQGVTTGEMVGGTYTVTQGTVPGGGLNLAAEIKTSFAYDAAGNLVKQQDARLNDTWTWYDKLGRKSAELDGEGYLTVWTRDAEGNVTQETRYAGKFDGSFTVSATSSVTSIRDHLVAVAGLENRVTDFTYDKNGNRLTETRRDVALNATATQTSAAPEAQVEYTYNKMGQVLSKEEATGDTTNYTYDDGGRLILEEGAVFTDYTGNAAARARTAYTYDRLNNLTKARVQAGAVADDTKDRVTLYYYDVAGRMTTMIVPTDIPDRSGMLSLGYDHSTISGSFAHYYGYDALGRTVSDRYTRSDSAGSTLAQEAILTRYDDAGNVALQSFARLDAGVWNFGFDATHMRYNSYGELIGRGTTAGANIALGASQETFDYDGAGRLYRTYGATGAIYNFYDKAGNQTLTLSSAGADLSSLAGYDIIGSIQSTGDTDLAGAITNVTVYDKRNQAIQTVEPDREIVNGSNVTTAQTVTRSKTYNAFGEVMSETDGRGNSTLFKYNTMGRILSKELPLVDYTNQSGQTFTGVHPSDTYTYDLSGRLIGVTDANNITSTRVLLAGTGYGGEEALVTREIRPGTGAYFDTLYDTFGDARILRNELYTGANAADSDELRYYDQQGRVIVVDHRGRGAANHAVDYYGYDGLGQRLWSYAKTYGSGQRNRTDYDTQGRIIKQVAMGGDTTDYTYSWSDTGAGSITGVAGRLTKTITGPAEKLTTGRYSSAEVTDYFGRIMSRTDLGGHVYTFGYTLAGQLSQRTNDQGENFSYTYHNTGQVKTAAASYTGSNTQSFSAEYRYDANGNRTYESNVANGSLTGFTGTTSYRTDATVTFDALNRVTSYVGSTTNGGIALSVAYKYDLVGNVRNTLATYRALDAQGNLSATNSTQDYWYLYDEMNRFTMAKASLNAGGTIGIVTSGSGVTGTGVKVEYDLAGRRKSATTVASKVVFGSPHSYERKEIYAYDADGNLIRTDLAEGVWTSGTTYTAAGSTGGRIAEYERDAMGRVTLYKEYNTPGSATVSYSKASTYNIKSQVTYDETYTLRTDGKTLTSFTWYQYTTSWDGYHNDTGKYLGGVVTYQYSESSGTAGGTVSDTYNYYNWWDGATLTQTVYRPTYASTTTNTSTYYLDDGGRTQWVDINDGRARKVYFLNDADGHVLSRDEWDNNTNTDPLYTQHGDPRDVHFYFNGQRIGNITNNGTSNVDTMTGIAVHIAVPSTDKNPFRNNTDYNPSYSMADFDQSYDAINGLNYDPTATSYTAQGGETLSMVAQNLWGDASFWYLIADANGMSSSVTLAAGQVLRIPNKVHNSHNTADTFRPYDPNEAMGDTSPTTPKKPKQMCGVFGQILMVAIAVAIGTILMGPGGLGAAFGGGFFGSVAGGAVAGAMASVFSQGFAVASGIQEKFSWKGVALGAISGAIGGGLGEIARGAQAGTNATQAATRAATTGAAGSVGTAAQGVATVSKFASALRSVGNFIGQGGFVGSAIRGVIGSALSQGIGVATGLQKKFDFASVAVAGVGAGVANSFKIDGVSPGVNNAITGMAGGIAGAAARSLITGTNFGDNLMKALPDIIGSTIGSLMVEGVTRLNKRRELPIVDAPIPEANPLEITGMGGPDEADEVALGRSLGPSNPDGYVTVDVSKMHNISEVQAILDGYVGRAENGRYDSDVNVVKKWVEIRDQWEALGRNPFLDSTPESPKETPPKGDGGFLGSGGDADDVVGAMSDTDSGFGHVVDILSSSLNGFINWIGTNFTLTSRVQQEFGQDSPPWANPDINSESGRRDFADGLQRWKTGMGWTMFAATTDTTSGIVTGAVTAPARVPLQTAGTIKSAIGAVGDPRGTWNSASQAWQHKWDFRAPGPLRSPFFQGYDVSAPIADTVIGFLAPEMFGGRVSAAERTGVDLSLTYKPGWSAAQRAEADLKVQILTEGDTVVSQASRSGTSAASRYRRAGNDIPVGNDIDHGIDLQLGGSDTVSNMWPLNSSVNRSLGAQIQQKIKNLPPGTVINKVTIRDR